MQILELGKQQAEEKELGDSAAERAGPTGPIGRGTGRGHSWEVLAVFSVQISRRLFRSPLLNASGVKILFVF